MRPVGHKKDRATVDPALVCPMSRVWLTFPKSPPSHQSQEAGAEQEHGGGEGDRGTKIRSIRGRGEQNFTKHNPLAPLVEGNLKFIATQPQIIATVPPPQAHPRDQNSRWWGPW